MAGLDGFSELLRQRAEEDDPVFNEEDLVAELIAEIPGAEEWGVTSLKDLKSHLATSAQTQGKFKDMEKGHTQATQRLAKMEETLTGRGITDIDAFLSGGPAKPADRKQRLREFLKKHSPDSDSEQYVPFYDELLELGKPEPDMTGQMVTNLLAKLSEYVFFDQFNRNEKYKGVDDETKGKLREKLRENPKAILEALDNLKNPLDKSYAEHFAVTNPEVIQKKIGEKAQEKVEAEKSSHLERPGAGHAPARVETDTRKAQDARADQVIEQTGVDLRE